MTPADLPFADSLRAFAGWNQTLEDWRRLLALEPDGCFVAETDGTPAGVATTTTYEGETAWIGMVLVHPGARGQGIGRALLDHCLEWLRSRNVDCIRLDATPAGEPLYQKLGFQPEWPLARWEGKVDGEELAEPGRTGDPAKCQLLEPAREPERSRAILERIGELDTHAFGIARQEMLEAMLPQTEWVAWCPSNDGEAVQAYGFLRQGARALYLGPAVAADSRSGVGVAMALLRAGSGKWIFWDIPETQTGLKRLAVSLGFTRQRSLLRMCLGENTRPGDPALQLAIADPSTG